MSRRGIALAVLAVLLAVGLALDPGDGRGDGGDRAADPATLLPTATPGDAIDSSWFCAGQSAGSGTVADGTLVLANAGPDAASARVTFTTSDGDEAARTVAVPARTTVRLPATEVVEADWVAAGVHVVGGTVVVEHEVVGPLGRDVAPCHSRSAERWYLAAGASTRDATMTLAVYNPLPGPATVDMSFATDDVVRQPPNLQGMLVPPRSLVVVPVSDIVTERANMSTTVLARRGRVVVDRIQTFDGTGAATTEEEAEAEPFRRRGLTVTPAVPDARPVWSFPASVSSEFNHEQVVVSNPGTRTVEVEIGVDLADRERFDPIGPFPLTVPAGSFSVFDVDGIEEIPPNQAHSITVRSADGSGVVAERSLSSVGDAPAVGEATSTGSPVAAEGWVFAAGPVPARRDDARYVVTNPGDEAVRVTVSSFGDGSTVPLPGGELTVEPGARVEVRPEDLPAGRASLLIEATGPVVAERRILTFTPVEVSAATDDETSGDDETPGEGGADDQASGSDGPSGDDATGQGTSVAVGIPLPRRLRTLR